MRILFMGTSEFAIPTLEMIRHSRWHLLGVVTQPDRPRGRGRKLSAPPVKKFLMGSETPVYQPAASQEIAELLAREALQPDVIVVVAYGVVLPSQVLGLPPLGCVNLHPSLLPAYRGAAPLQRAIINGETRTGITTMYLSEELDAGDIILQEEIEIAPDMTYGELADIASKKGASLMFKTLSLIEEGKAPRFPQDHSKATYAPPLRPEEERIDWKQDAKRICNKVRGMNPQPGAYTLFKGNVLKIWGAKPVEGNSGQFMPGQVVDADPKSGFSVQTGDGRIVVTEVQPFGRKRMSSAEFVRGYKIYQGLTLGE
ncbi:MAG: methionyl-tRNA formyltransferase [Thermacetogeniaceae bacterium]